MWASTWNADPGYVLLIAYGALVVFGGLALAYRERQFYEELAKQYDRMTIVFDHALDELTSSLSTPQPDIERAQEVIKALGREAMAEHAQWLILRRSHPLEPPVG